MYCGYVCKKTIVKICVSKEFVCDYYPMADKDTMKKLADKNFVLKVLDKP